MRSPIGDGARRGREGKPKVAALFGLLSKGNGLSVEEGETAEFGGGLGGSDDSLTAFEKAALPSESRRSKPAPRSCCRSGNVAGCAVNRPGTVALARRV